MTTTRFSYRMDYPVPDGRTVCQGHADACETFGHATYTIDNVTQGWCPRCGAMTGPDPFAIDPFTGKTPTEVY